MTITCMRDTQLRRLSVCDDLCSVVLEALRAIVHGCGNLEFLEVRNCKQVPPLEAAVTQAMLRSARRLPPALEWAPQANSVVVASDLL